MPLIEIAKVGSWPSESGAVVSLTKQMLSDVAESYDPDLYRAPFIVTHDEQNQPAWSSSVSFADQLWKAGALVKRLFMKGSTLVAEAEKVDPEYKSLFDNGRIPALSTKFYRPTDPGNPTPGHWAIRHVAGVLFPGIKGLAAPAFAEGDPGLSVLYLGEGMTAKIVGILSGLRQYLVDTVGADEAEKYIPTMDLAKLAVSEETEDGSMSMGMPKEDYQMGEKDKMQIAQPTFSEMPEAKELLLQLEALRQQNAELISQAAAEKRMSLQREALSFAEGLADSKKITPAEIDGVAAEYFAAVSIGSVSFGEGDSAKTVDPVQSLKARYSKIAPMPVPEGALNMGADPDSEPTLSFSEPAGLRVNPEKLKKLQEAQRFALENKTDLMTALKAVGVN